MKTIEVTYDTDGYIKDLSDNAVHFEQENDSLVVNAEITTDKKVRAYMRASNNNSTVTDELTPADGVYSCVVDSDYMAKGTLYMGFEIYDDDGYTERLEPLKIYIDGFVNLGGGSSDNVYVITLKVGSVQTLANGMPATVENVGTKKDMILNFGLPRGEQGIKGDKGDTGAQGQKGDKGDKGDPFEYDDFTDEQLEGLKGPKGDKGDKGDKGNQGIQGIQGAPGKDGYTPVKGVDYFTPADIASLGIDEIRKCVFDGYIETYNEEGNDITEYFDFDSYNAAGIYKIYERQSSDDTVSNHYILCVDTSYYDDIIQTLICLSTGEIKQRKYYGEWEKVSVSQNDIKNFATKTDLENAIGDIETSLENIIKKYGLGGDSQ